MEEKDRQFAQRYRSWIDGSSIPGGQAQAVWLRVSDALERCKGPPVRTGPKQGEITKRRSDK